MRTLQKLFATSMLTVLVLIVFIGLRWRLSSPTGTFVRSVQTSGKLQQRRPVVSRYHMMTPADHMTLWRERQHVLRFDCIKNHTSNSTVELIVQNNSIENGEEVTVSWRGVSTPTPKDWIGLYCPANAPTDVYYYHWYVDESSTYLNGYGEVGFIVYNIRKDCEFRYYRNETCTILLGRSNLLTFRGGANQPLQGHIALTGRPSEMRIQWTSGTKVTPTVNYGYSPDQLTLVATGLSSTYSARDMCAKPAIDPKNFIHPGFLHDVLLTNLKPDTIVFYQYGSKYATSPLHNFTTVPTDSFPSKEFSFITYGDLGVSPGAKTTIDNVLKEIQNGANLVLHQGDLSYTVGYSYVWEQWMSLIEPVATRVPYMVGIGNHEEGNDGFHPSWGNYGNDSNGECGVPVRYRFHMPDNGNSVYWYSFEYGQVHFTFISTEHNFTKDSDQYHWIEKDFKSVNRRQTPWLLVVGHRPMYTSENYPSDHLVSLHLQSDGLEELFHQYSVDMALWGHYHSYERTCKVYKQECTDAGVVNIIIGAAGASLDSASQLKVGWSKHLETNFGYGRVTVANGSALLWEYIRNIDSAVADSVWLIK